MTTTELAPPHAEDILASTYFPGGGATAPGDVVLRYTGRGPHPYATHFFNRQDRGYHWGHYFEDEAKARADYAERVRRGY